MGVRVPLPAPSDVRGRLVRTAYQGQLYPAGRHEWTWDLHKQGGTRVGAGIYFYQFAAGDFAQTKKLVVIE